MKSSVQYSPWLRRKMWRNRCRATVLIALGGYLAAESNSTVERVINCGYIAFLIVATWHTERVIYKLHKKSPSA